MSQSFSHKITLVILKLMGIKKDFSKDPIDYKKVRKQDVHKPKGAFFKKNSSSFTISDATITEVNTNSTSKKLILFIHGGAFICGPAKHHWDVLKKIAQGADSIVWMCDYPKAPENNIQAISNNIDEVYRTASDKYPSHDILLVGDSVGGTLITSLTQRLIQEKSKLPKRIVLVSPVMDATLSNPEIDAIDKIDPMLSKKGVLSAKKMCAQDMDLSNEMISPLNGSFEEFPSTVFLLGTNDITYPDQQLAVQKMKEAKVDIKVIEGQEMPHIWPFLPVMKEAKAALTQIISSLNEE